MTYRRERAPILRRDDEGEPTREDTGPGMPHGPEAAPVVDEDRPFSDGGVRYFTDVGFPATRADIVASAVEHGAPEHVLRRLATLPGDRAFARADDVLAITGDLEGELRERFDDNDAHPPRRD